MTNRRQEHIQEVLERMAYSFLLHHTLTEAETLGYSPYDFKIVADHLTLERGFVSLEHLTDAAYDSFMLARRNERKRP